MTSATAAAPKSKLNLSSVTPAPPVLEAITSLTPGAKEEPAFVAFTQRDVMKWGQWLLYRLQEHWPYLHGLGELGRLYPHMSGNSSLFVRNKLAILLAVETREPLEPRPFVDIVFAFKHHPEKREQDKEVRVLFRAVDEWARARGAQQVRVLHQERLDTNYSITKDILGGEDGKYLYKEVK